MYILTIVLAIFALIFLVMMFMTANRNDPASPVLGMLSVITNLVVAGKISVFEIPYQVVTENTAENAMTVINEGVQEVTSAAPMSYLFLGFALVSMIWVFIIVFRKITREMPF